MDVTGLVITAYSHRCGGEIFRSILVNFAENALKISPSPVVIDGRYLEPGCGKIVIELCIIFRMIFVYLIL